MSRELDPLTRLELENAQDRKQRVDELRERRRQALERSPEARVEWARFMAADDPRPPSDLVEWLVALLQVAGLDRNENDEPPGAEELRALRGDLLAAATPERADEFAALLAADDDLLEQLAERLRQGSD